MSAHALVHGVDFELALALRRLGAAAPLGEADQARVSVRPAERALEEGRVRGDGALEDGVARDEVGGVVCKRELRASVLVLSSRVISNGLTASVEVGEGSAEDREEDERAGEHLGVGC